MLKYGIIQYSIRGRSKVTESLTFEQREIVKQPSTERIRRLRYNYLSEPLMIDPEYIYRYMEAHRKTDGMNVLERRAECHAYALENINPVIRDNELIVGSKTRFVHGVIPYCNYASDYIRRFFEKE